MLGGKNRAVCLFRGIDLAENDAYCPWAASNSESKLWQCAVSACCWW